ncbi:unnamed protein product, partial [Rotaria sordida]
YEQYQRELNGLKQLQQRGNLTDSQDGRYDFVLDAIASIKPFYGYRITISVYIRDHLSPSAQIHSFPPQSQHQQQLGAHSGTSVTPS